MVAMTTKNLLAAIIVLSAVIGSLSLGASINAVNANQTAGYMSTATNATNATTAGNMTSGNVTSGNMVAPTNMTSP
jgi:hypothetical protein